MSPPKKHIAILGATGSIGTQALEVIRAHSDLFELRLISAHSQVDLLAEIAAEFRPDATLVALPEARKRLRAQLEPEGLNVYDTADFDELIQTLSIDLVLVAVVGFSGLAPTLSAIREGKDIALANKEAIVAGGALVTEALRRHGVQLLPIDSEHSAIFQCLLGESRSSVQKLILTASGGPFWTTPSERLAQVQPADALKHPTWKMGPKVSIDSATMMNKGLEIIEAHWLFDIPLERIEVLVHRQSWVHSLVEFVDGSLKAQLGPSDMRLPIQLAMSYPNRLPLDVEPLQLDKLKDLSFEAPDEERFPALRIAREAMVAGGNIPCALNAANECAVEAFLQGRISFTKITQLTEACLEKIHYIAQPNYADIFDTDTQSRSIMQQLTHR